MAGDYAFKVSTGVRVRLSEHDPKANAGLSQEQAEPVLGSRLTELTELQEELFGAGQHALLVVLQGRDASGKDGVIRKVLSRFSPQGMHVTAFSAPTPEELGHDFLWRVHRVVPRLRMVGVFNRSHYEDVLVARVHELVPKHVWERRYDQINAFEELLTAANTIVVKFFLHISREEQLRRFRERAQDPLKAWELSADDWRDRERWDDYERAYEDALSACTTVHAPWYIVPADHKWFRDLAVGDALVHALRPYRDTWRATLEEMSRQRRAEIEARLGAAERHTDERGLGAGDTAEPIHSRVEREVKLDAPTDFRLEDVDLGPGLRLGMPSEKLMTSSYYDTSDLRLAAHHGSLRFRDGEVWTVKLEVQRGGNAVFRAEHVVRAGGERVPEPALDLVAAFSRRAPLQEVARLHTTRKAAPVLNESGAQVAEIVDDRVSVMDGDAQIAAFHEIEVELANGAPEDVLDRIVRKLRSAGAAPSDQLPKLARALLARSVSVDRHGPPTKRVRTVGGLLVGAITESYEAIVHNDPGIRLGLDPENVHQPRVATRRLRSDLRAFRPMLDAAWCDHLREELAWLGQALGSVRDGDVLLTGLRNLAGRLPVETTDSVVRLLERLADSLSVKRAELLVVLRSKRYLELLDQLANVAVELPLSERARTTDVESLPRLMRKPWRRLVRSVKALSAPPTDDELHAVRIRAKRCRYLAEALIPVAGKEARKFAAACRELQDVLGEHQDTVVARQWLRSVIPEVSAPEAFAAGQLHVLEQEATAAPRQAWPRAWRKLRRPSISKWWRRV